VRCRGSVLHGRIHILGRLNWPGRGFDRGERPQRLLHRRPDRIWACAWHGPISRGSCHRWLPIACGRRPPTGPMVVAATVRSQFGLTWFGYSYLLLLNYRRARRVPWISRRLLDSARLLLVSGSAAACANAWLCYRQESVSICSIEVSGCTVEVVARLAVSSGARTRSSVARYCCSLWQGWAALQYAKVPSGCCGDMHNARTEGSVLHAGVLLAVVQRHGRTFGAPIASGRVLRAPCNQGHP